MTVGILNEITKANFVFNQSDMSFLASFFREFSEFRDFFMDKENIISCSLHKSSQFVSIYGVNV